MCECIFCSLIWMLPFQCITLLSFCYPHYNNHKALQSSVFFVRSITALCFYLKCTQQNLLCTRSKQCFFIFILVLLFLSLIVCVHGFFGNIDSSWCVDTLSFLSMEHNGQLTKSYMFCCCLKWIDICIMCERNEFEFVPSSWWNWFSILNRFSRCNTHIGIFFNAHRPIQYTIKDTSAGNKATSMIVAK